MILFDFKNDSSLSNWTIVNDVVMGGSSDSKFYLNEKGHVVFTGTVSLENNGGFTSVRYLPSPSIKGTYGKVHIRLKGDGKKYQFRVRSDRYDYFSYITSFSTSGEWETITLELNKMYPAFRGRTLNQPNFSGDTIEEIAFLIGNKRAEKFELQLDKIELE